MFKINVVLTKLVASLQSFQYRWWFAPVLGLLAALDNLILIIPTDGILISSVILKPKKWVYLALVTAVGSTIGALLLAILVEQQGLPALLHYYPDLDKTRTWLLVYEFFQSYGLLCIFIVSMSPVVQMPAVVIASLALTPFAELAFVIFAGRLLKFLLFSYVGSHMPKLLSKFWGLQGELNQVGVKTQA